MDTLVIQVGSRHGRTAEIHKSRGQDVKIGRGFNNDLVLSDPYVAPDQLRITNDSGQWSVEVLDDTNPVLLNDKAVTGNTGQIKPGDRLKVGRTNLFIFSEAHPVEATHKLLLSSWLHGDNAGLLVPFSLLVFVCLLDGFVDYINYATTDEWSLYLYGSISLAVLILLWAGAWSLLGRITRHPGRGVKSSFMTFLLGIRGRGVKSSFMKFLLGINFFIGECLSPEILCPRKIV